MAGYLNFDPNRKLAFETSRPLDFQTGRPLDFQPSRALGFQPNRDLGFGQRGVVFRGYVCPVCGALMAPDAPSCNECGTMFGGQPAPPAEAPPAVPEPPPAAPPPAKASAATQPAKVAYCAYCGVKLRAGDAYCWNCGSVAKQGAEVVKLPPKKSEAVTRDWRASRER